MASNAFAGVGTKFRRWGGSAWADIAEVNSISGPSPTRETIDVTSLDSTGGYREYIPSFRDGGQVQLGMNFTRETYDLMKADFDSDDTNNYEVLFPDDENTSIEFTGYVIELPVEVSTDDKVTANVTIQVTGEIVVNSGSGSGS